MSQIRIVESSPPEIARVPSGEKATERDAPACPSKVRRSCPLDTSHSLTVLRLPESKRVPSGESAADELCSPMVLNRRPVAASHTLRVPGWLFENMRPPSGEKSTNSIGL